VLECGISGRWRLTITGLILSAGIGLAVVVVPWWALNKVDKLRNKKPRFLDWVAIFVVTILFTVAVGLVVN